MLFSVNRLIAEVSKFMTLKVGDSCSLAPLRVAAVQSGDRLWVRWKGTTFLPSTSSDFVILSQTHTHLSLIGFMGSGKSWKKLAERLDRPFVDTDEEVEKMLGMPAARCSIPWGNRLEADRMPCPMPFAPTTPLFWRRWRNPVWEGAMEWMRRRSLVVALQPPMDVLWSA